VTIHRFTGTLRGGAAAALLLAALAGCGQDAASDAKESAQAGARGGADGEESPGEPAPEEPRTPDDEPAAEETTPGDGPTDEATDGPRSPAAFDLASVPLSDVPLGEFPYLAIPDGYENPNREKPVVAGAHAPFWTGDQLLWAEGTVYQSLIHAERGREFSRMELQGFIENAVTELGGVPVTDSEIPSDVVYSIDEEITAEYHAGLGDIYNDRVKTYLIRQADRTVWIHFCASTASAGWLIAEAETDPMTEMP
jgi:hypothetical protein